MAKRCTSRPRRLRESLRVLDVVYCNAARNATSLAVLRIMLMDEVANTSGAEEIGKPIKRRQPMIEAPWWKLGMVVLILLVPLWGSALACCLSAEAALWFASTFIEGTLSAFRGFYWERYWQLAVVIGWLSLATGWWFAARFAFVRASVGLAMFVALGSIAGAAVLVGQQKAIDAAVMSNAEYLND